MSYGIMHSESQGCLTDLWFSKPPVPYESDTVQALSPLKPLYKNALLILPIRQWFLYDIAVNKISITGKYEKIKSIIDKNRFLG
jgi:hypothetical protein